MKRALRFVCAIGALTCTVAIGAPDKAGAPPAPTLRPGDVLVLPYQWPSPQQPSVRPFGYESYNGLLYQRGAPHLEYLPDGGVRQSVGGELYGPVVPGRYHAEGVTGDQLFLSIVRVQPRRAEVARGQTDPTDQLRRTVTLQVRIAALRARLAALRAALQQPGLSDDLRRNLEARKAALEAQLAEAEKALGIDGPGPAPLPGAR